MEGQEFLDVNQVLQKAVVHENRAKEHKSYSQFKDVGPREKERSHVCYVEGDSTSDDDTEICVAEWVDTRKVKPITCSFLKPNIAKRDEVKYIFNVSKCDKLFDNLLKVV
jgi:hypothetical protein